MNRFLKVAGNNYDGAMKVAESLKDVDYDVIVILSPHWQTYVGTHFIGVEKCSSKRLIQFSPIYSDSITI